jgi:NAD(P)-dependent dehydrogenase (short-subunit alcohol dehydrogenase family)
MEMANKRALVLGGTSGIGFATAEKLAAAGAEVIAGGLSEAGIETARSGTGDSIAYRAIDVLDRDALAGLFADSAPFDILVSTAAPRGRAQGLFPQMDLDAFQGAFGKLWGYVNSVRLGLEHMTDAGSIVVVSGSPARKALPGTSAISTVGNAVEGFVRAIAPEIAPVRINAVSPGAIDTPLIPLQGEQRQQYFEKIVGDQVIQRVGQPGEVADAVMFLLRNDFITGTVVDVDGGALLP